MVNISKNLKPSDRGELEITGVNNVYLKRGDLKVKVMPNGSAWLDAGTAESFFDTSSYIRTIQRRQGVCIGCLESICLEQNFIDVQQYDRLLRRIPKSSYKNALRGKFFIKTNIYNYDIINWWYRIRRTEISRDFVFSKY